MCKRERARRDLLRDKFTHHLTMSSLRDACASSPNLYNPKLCADRPLIALAHCTPARSIAHPTSPKRERPMRARRAQVDAQEAVVLPRSRKRELPVYASGGNMREIAHRLRLALGEGELLGEHAVHSEKHHEHRSSPATNPECSLAGGRPSNII